jgi:RNA methyltransferase, TrmH family
MAAVRLRRRRDRERAGRFLAEGPPAVREALGAGVPVHELFVTRAAVARHGSLVGAARAAGVPVSAVTDDAAAALSQTVTPPGLVAVCDHLDRPLGEALAAAPRLVAVLAGVRDPGNAGTVLRTGDAAGVAAVVFAGDAVDPYNGKCVRASAGSLFHVDVVRARDPVAAVADLGRAGLRVLAATAHGGTDLDTLPDGVLAGPTAWLFGSEAHGLPAGLARLADEQVRVPIHGRAESLNLAAAAAVCLYTSARAQRREESIDDPHRDRPLDV